MDVSLWPIVIAPESLIFLSVSCAFAKPVIAHAASRAMSSVETRFMSLSPWFDDGRRAAMIQSSVTDTPCPDAPPGGGVSFVSRRVLEPVLLTRRTEADAPARTGLQVAFSGGAMLGSRMRAAAENAYHR